MSLSKKKKDIDAMPKADKKDKKSASALKTKETAKSAKTGPKVASSKEILAAAAKIDEVRVG